MRVLYGVCCPRYHTRRALFTGPRGGVDGIVRGDARTGGTVESALRWATLYSLFSRAALARYLEGGRCSSVRQLLAGQPSKRRQARRRATPARRSYQLL